MTIREIKKQIRGVFKLPKRKWYLGLQKHGTPYFYPIGYLGRVIKIRRLKLKPDSQYKEYIKLYPHNKGTPSALYSNLPLVRRSSNKILFSTFLDSAFYIEWGWPIAVHIGHLGWKDKYNTPRYEWAPNFHIFFFGLQLCYWWVPDVDYLDGYWEQVLWYTCYSDKDIDKAKETWVWQDSEGNSTWSDKYLVQ